MPGRKHAFGHMDKLMHNLERIQLGTLSICLLSLSLTLSPCLSLYLFIKQLAQQKLLFVEALSVF